jgi:hypothetical protein
MVLGVVLLPESPRFVESFWVREGTKTSDSIPNRWLLKHGHVEDAKAILCRLRAKPLDSVELQTEFTGLQESIKEQTVAGPFRFKELISRDENMHLYRTAVAMTSQAFQQIGTLSTPPRTF